VPEYNVFDSDLHRRVAGNLQIPRSVEALVLTLERHDPGAISSWSGSYNRGETIGQLGEVLSDLEADGVVINIGEHQTPDDAVEAVNDDPNAVDIPEDQAERFVTVVQSSRPSRRHLNVQGELWVLTNKGLEKLTGSIPNEPPPVANGG